MDLKNEEQLQNYITSLSINNGALLVGYTIIRKTEPVIILGFPYSDKWFFKFPITLTKSLGKVYGVSKHVQDLVAKELKNEGYDAHYKTVLSIYGDFRPLAVSAGLGEWGKNGLVVNRKYGSNLLFAAIFTNAPFSTTPKDGVDSEEHCTQCGQCIDACPAHAFEGGRFHLSRCMPYAIRGCAECLKGCSGNKLKN